jgi:hypothetical protein
MTSKTDVWVAGFTSQGAISGAECTYTAHWNGTSWTTVPTPSPDGQPGGSVLTSISARISTNVWAVGATPEATTGTPRTEIVYNPLALHWNGTSWQQVRSVGDGVLTDVDATGNSIWAVGQVRFGKICPTCEDASHAMFIQRWDGSAFIAQSVQDDVGGPAVSSPQAELGGISVRGGLVVSVGQYQTTPDIRRSAALTDLRPDN